MFSDLKELVIQQIEKLLLEMQTPAYRAGAAQAHTTAERLAAEYIFYLLVEKQIQTNAAR